MRGRLHPTVTEQAADDRRALADRERPRGKGCAIGGGHDEYSANGSAFLQNIGRDALGDPFRRVMDRVLSQMGVAGRRLDVAVPEQLADHR